MNPFWGSSSTCTWNDCVVTLWCVIVNSSGSLCVSIFPSLSLPHSLLSIPGPGSDIWEAEGGELLHGEGGGQTGDAHQGSLDRGRQGHRQRWQDGESTLTPEMTSAAILSHRHLSARTLGSSDYWAPDSSFHHGTFHFTITWSVCVLWARLGVKLKAAEWAGAFCCCCFVLR